MSSLPKIRVFNKPSKIKNKPGLASKVALVGAFDSDESNPILCSDITEAYDKLGKDTSYDGVICLDKLFYGASSILAVNITTKTPTLNKEVTPAKLTSALSKIKGEDFDLLYVAAKIDDTLIPIITTFLDEKYEAKQPSGYVAFSDFAANLAGDFSYGLLKQQLTIDSKQLSEVESGAYYCGLLASLNVGNSMTMKIAPEVEAINPEYSFEQGGTGLSLLTDGFTLLKCQDRANKEYVVVNSEQPNGFDLYINRTRDFVVKEMMLHKFLGERNRTATLNEIKQELDRVKEKCVNTLDLLEDIEYGVEKKNAKCVDVNIIRLLFAGIITDMNVHVTIEVE